jgi:hypothetical protein
VFTARYGLIPYITQIRFVVNGLIRQPLTKSDLRICLCCYQQNNISKQPKHNHILIMCVCGTVLCKKTWYLFCENFKYVILLTMLFRILKHCFGVKKRESLSCRESMNRLCPRLAPHGQYNDMEK